jgi:ankyrin repeat protein
VDFNCPSCGEIILIDKIIHKKNEKLLSLVIKKTKVSSTIGKSNIYPKQFVKLDDIINAKEIDKEHNIAPRLVFIFLGLLILFGIGSIIYKKIFVVRDVDVWAEIEKGNTDEIEYYLKHGGDINVTDMYECDMLHNAVTENKLPITKLLINHGIEINNKEPDYSNTPLAIACEFGFFDMAKLLIDNNADYKVKNVDHDTPLLIALKNKSGQYYNIINLLVNKGAKINRLDHAQTILIHLILEGRYLAIEDLVKNKNYDINKFNIYGESALHVACVLGNIDLVQLLIENGADVNLISKDQYEHSPLSSLLFYKAFEASVLYKHKNNSMVSEMMPGMMGMGMPGMNPYGMSGMMPGNDWPAKGNTIDISMMNGNTTLSKPLSSYNNPSQKIYTLITKIKKTKL